MARSSTARAVRSREEVAPFDRELADLPPALRWREWMLRVEAVIFASAEPVSRSTLTRVVGMDCSLEQVIDDLNAELEDRPYQIVAVAGGWQHRTRNRFADSIRAATASTRSMAPALSEFEAMVLMVIGYFQPVTRAELSRVFGKEISRDTIGAIRNEGFIATGPRSPTPGAPYTYVTTKQFLSAFGMNTLRDLPDFEALEDAGLLSKKEPVSDMPASDAEDMEDD